MLTIRIYQYITMPIKQLTSISIIALIFPSSVFAGPVSTSYELKQWDFYSGSASVSSTNYDLRGETGEYDATSASSTNFRLNGGLTFDLNASVPPAPNLTNPSGYDTQLKLVINKDVDAPTDVKYAISISTDDFVSDIRYVRADHSVGTNLTVDHFQNYTLWGGASGFNITSLSPGTTYKTRVSAIHGYATQSPFGPNSASAATVNTTISYDIDVSATDTETSAPYTINFGNLTPGSVITATNKIWLDLSTNAGSGSTIYVTGSNGGLKSSRLNYTIASANTNLTSASEGYGAISNSATQTSGGPFTPLSPYNGSGNNVGILDSTMRSVYNTSGTGIVDGRVSFYLKAKSGNSTPASNDYADTLTIIVAPIF